MNSEEQNLYFIKEIQGYSPDIGKLVTMMEYTRYTTIEAIKGLTVEDLDYHFDDKSNSIGMLLTHMICVEKAFQIMTFEDRDLTDKEWEELSVGIILGDVAKRELRGKDIHFYLDRLSATRKETLLFFRTCNDEWLTKVSTFGWDYPANNHFKWFHVFEDEINHRGQIRLITKRIGN